MASVAARTWKKPDGSTGRGWQVRYIDPATGKRPGKMFDLKKEAEAYKRKVEREIEDGTHIVAAGAMTVKQVCEQYMSSCDAKVERGEIGRGYAQKLECLIRLHIVPEIGATPFKNLTTENIDDLYNVLTKRLDAAYARVVLGKLATIERFAGRRRYVLTTPVASALQGIRAPAAARIREFTPEEINRLLRACLTKPRGWQERRAAMLAAFVHLSACCGLRIGEIRALDWNSVDLERGQLAITRSITQGMELKGTKSVAGRRDVPLPDHLVTMLRVWGDRHAITNDGGYVFSTSRGKPIDHRDMLRSWYALLDAVGLGREDDGFHFHALRHFAGSWWIANGMPITDVALQLGHGDASTTLRVYAHAISKLQDRRPAMARISAALVALPDAIIDA